MTIRTLGTLVAAPVLATGLLGAVAPTATAQDVTTQVPVTHSCVSISYPNVPLVSDLTNGTRTVSETVTVTAPERVDPGSTFTIRIQPGQMRIDRATSRLTYDIAVPTGAELTGYSIVGGGSGYSGNAQLVRVDANGNPSATGPFLRLIAENAHVHNRPSWARGNFTAGWQQGIRAGANTNFRLPQVSLTLRAPQTEGVVTTSLRPGAAAEGTNYAMGFLAAVRTVQIPWTSYRVTIGHANYCTSSPQTLSTTRVHPVYTTATEVDVQLEALTGDEVRMTATVSPTPDTGVVEFYDGETKIGEAEVSDGTAEMVWRFRDPGAHPVTARYVGTQKYLASESDPQTVTVTVPGEVVVEPEPEVPEDPAPEAPTDPGLLGSLTGSLGS
ncbi:Ig-like domain-containing protein [Dietzia maris]|uniref:Ig-like domain-containing protein n=1 Tax=Dietzia maris TaxID=37915 RepID=UPI0037CB525E